MRSKLRELKQTSSVTTYNAEFLRLSMQLSDLGELEATSYYLTGVKEEIRNYVVSNEANLTDLHNIQLACLRQDQNMNCRLKTRHPNTTDALLVNASEKSKERQPTYVSGHPR